MRHVPVALLAFLIVQAVARPASVLSNGNPFYSLSINPNPFSDDFASHVDQTYVDPEITPENYLYDPSNSEATLDRVSADFFGSLGGDSLASYSRDGGAGYDSDNTSMGEDDTADIFDDTHTVTDDLSPEIVNRTSEDRSREMKNLKIAWAMGYKPVNYIPTASLSTSNWGEGGTERLEGGNAPNRETVVPTWPQQVIHVDPAVAERLNPESTRTRAVESFKKKLARLNLFKPSE
ncbi:hypothetical protein IWQ60_004984 [Tieghemiomyces parasiticus]|uniref:Uncharacterized protein n=1 Tax=Tieghemiomyces parasiticus TaxID=78921 RepID=A0A9W8DYM8_9FUNG|nr:hypothetical protein IWQ60_004984 [Tieghemiomyces parasiticus]